MADEARPITESSTAGAERIRSLSDDAIAARRATTSAVEAGRLPSSEILSGPESVPAWMLPQIILELDSDLQTHYTAAKMSQHPMGSTPTEILLIQSIRLLRAIDAKPVPKEA